MNVLLTSQDINRALIRIAHEIIENNRSCQSIVLIGLVTRGVPLAHRLASLIHEFEGVITKVGALDFRGYRDDINYDKNPPNRKLYSNISIQITDSVVILVDDVLSTGRSIRAAMDALVHIGRPKCIQLAVLIDRGHREMPIKADYVGKNIPSSRKERIQVKLTETDSLDSVIIMPNIEKQLSGK